MAEPRSNKTERPTSRRLQKSREQGQIPRSKELPAALALGAVVLFGRVFGEGFITEIGTMLSAGIATAGPIVKDPLSGEMTVLLAHFRSAVLSAVTLGAPLVGLVAVGSAVGQFSQGGFVLSADPLKPKGEKFNPASNLKKVVSLKGIVGGIRAALKLGLIVWVIWATLIPEWEATRVLGGRHPAAIFAFASEVTGRVLFKFFLLAMGLALIDYLYQKFEHMRGLKMSKKEIKDEQKDLEGDPLIRGRMRAKQMAMARRRMMSEVPDADVVVVNPTHCAVALKYEGPVGGAPRVVAKGAEHLARKIREVAEEHGVPVYEDAPLAWALYRAVDVGREIPEDLYKAVAEVLAHVFRLRGARPLKAGAAPGSRSGEAGGAGEDGPSDATGTPNRDDEVTP